MSTATALRVCRACCERVADVKWNGIVALHFFGKSSSSSNYLLSTGDRPVVSRLNLGSTQAGVWRDTSFCPNSYYIYLFATRINCVSDVVTLKRYGRWVRYCVDTLDLDGKSNL